MINLKVPAGNDIVAADSRLAELLTLKDEYLRPLVCGKLGFFTSPYLVVKGPLSGKVVKLYRGVKSTVLCRRVKLIHSSYITHLQQAGIRLPPTEIDIVTDSGENILVVTQEAFRKEELVREIMARQEPKRCFKLLTLLLEDTFRMIDYMHQNKELNIGFHPTLRNYALRGDSLSFFDTFPPMIQLTKSELEWIVMYFAPYKVPKILLPFCKPFMHYVTHEYYNPVTMLTGLVGSACRLRPELAGQFLSTASDVLDRFADKFPEIAGPAIKELSRPPRLSLLWLLSRKMFGKEGAPNL